MKPSVYKLNTLSLFNDLKNTNIKKEDFKSILASYKSLETFYAKSNNVDLLKDLNKQRDVIFSYLPSCRQESIKKIAKLFNNLESEVGNIDELDTLQTPEKNIQFVKVAYNDGKWTIFAHNLEDAEFTDEETPEAINCLVSIANRLDEQDAAYALCHAKKAGLFTMAALPYVRTEDFTDTALETRFIKDPGTTLGPQEKSWNSSVDNTNMPVSRQIASDEFEEEKFETDLGFDDIKESTELLDEDGSMLFVSAKDSDTIIANNQVYTREEVDENLGSGSWKILYAAKEDIKLKRIEKEAESLLQAYEEKLILDEAAQRLKDEFNEKVNSAIKSQAEKSDELVASVEPRLKKLAAKIDEITFKDKAAKQKFQKLRYTIGNIELSYQKPVEEYQRKAISNVEQVEELLETARKYVSPKNLKAFENEVVDKFFYFNSRAEQFDVALTSRNPKNEELIQDKVKELKKNIKTSQDNKFYKDSAYEELDNMLIDNTIDFNTYNQLSDFAELNAKQVLSSLKEIKAGLEKPAKAGILDSIKDIFAGIKSWLSNVLSYLTLQDKQATDINEELDSIIPEGE